MTEVTSGRFTLQPGQSNVNTHDNATCPPGTVVVGTGYDDGAVMTVGFVESFHTFVDGFIANDSSIAADYEWQAICAASSSGAAADIASAQDVHRLKLAALRRWRSR